MEYLRTQFLWLSIGLYDNSTIKNIPHYLYEDHSIWIEIQSSCRRKINQKQGFTQHSTTALDKRAVLGKISRV